MTLLRNILPCFVKMLSRLWVFNLGRNTLLGWLPPVPEPQASIRLRSGVRLRAYYPGRSDSISGSLYWYGEFEPWVCKMIRVLAQPGDTVIDIGANIGAMTLIAAETVGPEGTVVSVEPMPTHAEKLAANIESNGFCNVRIIRAAISDSNGWVNIAMPDGKEGHACVVQDGNPAATPVHSLRLDHIVHELGVQSVAVCKVDVEKHEGAVLAGAIKTIRRRVVAAWLLERHNSTSDDTVWRQFLDSGYRVWQIRRSVLSVRLVELGHKSKGWPTDDYLVLRDDVPTTRIKRWCVN